MTEAVEAEQILKTDKLGRVQVPAERREAILDEFERSGMSGAAFAKLHGIKYQTFAGWRAKRKKNATEGKPAVAPQFVVLETGESGEMATGPGEGMEIKLADGTCLRVCSRDQAVLAADFIRSLRS